MQHGWETLFRHEIIKCDHSSFDGDSCDEICGAMTVDHDGKGTVYYRLASRGMLYMPDVLFLPVKVYRFWRA